MSGPERSARIIGKKAVLCGNLAVCFGEMGRLSDAVRYYVRGTGCVREQGGVVLYLQLLRIGMGLASRAGEDGEAFREQELIRRIVSDLWGAGGGGKARFLFSAAAARDFHSVVAISHSVL